MSNERLPQNIKDLAEFLHAATACYASRPFLGDLSYGDLARYMEQMEREWKGYGLAPGDCVAIQIEDRFQCILLTLALLHSRAIPVMLHPHLAQIHVQACLQRTGAQYYLGKHAADRSLAFDLGKRLQPQHRLSAKGVALVASTSGTHSLTRLVQHTHAAPLNNVQGILSYLSLTPEDSILILREPSYLSAFVGEVLLGIARGCRLSIAQKRITPNGLINQIRQHQVTMLVGTATLFHLSLPILRRRTGDLTTLKIVLLVGEGAHLQTLLELQDLLPQAAIFHCYGLTEAGPRLTYWSAKHHPPSQFCVGLPLPGVELRIRQEQEKVGAHQAGVIEVASSSMMIGYVDDPPLTDRWLSTNDWGWIDDQGFVFVQGRVDDILIRSGVKIPPTVIEDVLLQYPGVQGAMVKGRTSAEYDLEIEGYVVLDTDVRASELDLLHWCRRFLPDSMWPNALHLVNALPVKPSGKLDRS